MASNYFGLGDAAGGVGSGHGALVEYKAANQVAGDQEWQWNLHLAAYPTATAYLGGGSNVPGTRNFNCNIYNTGTFNFQYSEDGTNWITAVLGTVPLADDLWLKVTLDVDGGTGGIGLVSSYTSVNGGMTWTPLASVDAVGSTAPSFVKATAAVGHGIGGYDYNAAGNTDFDYIGYRFLDGIDGTIVYNVDFRNLTVAELEAAEFVEKSVNAATVTLLGDEWAYVRPVPASLPLLGEGELVLEAGDGNKGLSPRWADRSGKNHHAEKGSAPGDDTNDSLFKGYEDADGQYAYFPGTINNWASTPNTNLLDANSAHNYQDAGYWVVGDGTFALEENLDGFADIGMLFTADGGAELRPIVSRTSTAGQGIGNNEITVGVDVEPLDSDIEVLGIVAAYDVSDVFLGNFAFPTGPTITQGTTTRVEFTVTPPNVLTDAVACTFRFYRDGGSEAEAGDRVRLTNPCIRLGADGAFVPSLNIQDDLELEWRGKRADWVTGASGHMIGTRNSGSNGYHMIEQSEGGGESGVYCRFGNGTVQRAFNMFVGEVIDPDRVVTVKTTYEEGVGWKGYLDGVFVDGVANLDAGPGASQMPLSTGARPDGASTALEGSTYHAIVRDGIGGPIVAHFDADGWAEPYATETDEQGHVWTMGRSATGLVATIVDRDMELFTTDDYARVTDHSGLDFGGAKDFTIMAAVRYSVAGAGTDYIVAKKVDNTTGAGYHVLHDASQSVFKLGDGAFNPQVIGTRGPDDTLEIVVGVRDAGADEISAYVDGEFAATSTDTTTATLANAMDLIIGATSHGPGQFFEGQIIAIVLWRRILTPAEIVRAGAELTRLPAEELGRHGDALLAYLKDNYTITSGEVVSALNEFNGITGVGRKEYKGARDTAFGL